MVSKRWEVIREWHEVQNECFGPEKVHGAYEYYVFVTDKQIRRGKRGEYVYSFPRRLATISGPTLEACSDEFVRFMEIPNTILVNEKGETLEQKTVETSDDSLCDGEVWGNS